MAKMPLILTVSTSSDFTDRLEAESLELSAEGEYSIAMGVATSASGDGSTAMGVATSASGDGSTAMGLGTRASGNVSTAMGYGTEASKFASTAMGRETIASGDHSTAMGFKTEASGDYSIAMGSNTKASGDPSTAMGDGTRATGDYSTAMGLDTRASGRTSTAMGYGTEASKFASTAVGDLTRASGDYSTAMGKETEASGNSSTAMGSNTKASGDASTAMGLSTRVGLLKDINDSLGSIKTASEALVDHYDGYPDDESVPAVLEDWKKTLNSLKAEYLSEIEGDESVLAVLKELCLAATPKFSDGEVLDLFDSIKSLSPPSSDEIISSPEFTSAVDSLNEFIAACDGAIELDVDDRLLSGVNGLATGNGTRAYAKDSTAMGAGTAASGKNSTAMGFETRAEGTSSIAMGYKTRALGENSTAMGFETTASGKNSTAMGDNTVAWGPVSTAMGEITQTGPVTRLHVAFVSLREAGKMLIGDIGEITDAAWSHASSQWNDAKQKFVEDREDGWFARTRVGLETGGGPEVKVWLDKVVALAKVLDDVPTDKPVSTPSVLTTVFDGDVIKTDYDLGDRLEDIPQRLRGENALAAGENSVAHGKNSTALGFETVAGADKAMAVGSQTKAMGDQSFATGFQAVASGSHSTAIGYQTIASGGSSIAMGQGTLASGQSSTAMGVGTVASGQGWDVDGNDGSTAMGKYNAPTDVNGDHYLLSVGNGTAEGDRSNALAVTRGGVLEVSGEVKANGGMTVSGPLTAYNGLGVTGGSLLVATSGLDVTGGPLYAKGGLGVTGPLTANNGLIVTGGITVDGQQLPRVSSTIGSWVERSAVSVSVEGMEFGVRFDYSQAATLVTNNPVLYYIPNNNLFSNGGFQVYGEYKEESGAPGTQITFYGPLQLLPIAADTQYIRMGPILDKDESGRGYSKGTIHYFNADHDKAYIYSFWASWNTGADGISGSEHVALKLELVNG